MKAFVTLCCLCFVFVVAKGMVPLEPTGRWASPSGTELDAVTSEETLHRDVREMSNRAEVSAAAEPDMHPTIEPEDVVVAYPLHPTLAEIEAGFVVVPRGGMSPRAVKIFTKAMVVINLVCIVSAFAAGQWYEKDRCQAGQPETSATFRSIYSTMSDRLARYKEHESPMVEGFEWGVNP